MSNLAEVRSPDFRPMSVAKMGFLVDRLHRDCAPLQFVRELTKNSIESIEALGDEPGEIRWDVDWIRFALLGDASAKKLAIVDTGKGMTGEEMVEYINKLSSSIHQQADNGNFGVGAKISAAPLNRIGLIYLSWVDDHGYMIHLIRDDLTGNYGLKRFENGEFWTRISNDLKPEPIGRHGTMVVLMGNDEDQSTIDPPPNVRMPRKWILRYLNSRFFAFPSNVTVKVREGWDLPRGDQHNFLRKVTGQGPWLADNAEQSGVVDLPLTRAKVHWWIVRDDVDTNSGHYASPGHVAALFQNELYEMVSASAGLARLQAFGVVFGANRVVLYVEPLEIDRAVSANTARTSLLLDNEAVDWSEFASEFRELMPQELRDFQDSIGEAANQTDHRKAIRDRLATIKDLFKFGRYRPKPGGKYLSVATENTGGEDTAKSEETRRAAESSKSGTKGSRNGDIYALFAEESGDPSEAIANSVEPEVKWISTSNGTRIEGDLEDRAARYRAEQNLLLINADFRAFTDMTERWEAAYEGVPGCRAVIEDVVHEWFEQQLIETVMSALALKNHGKWSLEELAALWDDTALTAAVLPRYHINMSIKRILGQRLGRLQAA